MCPFLYACASSLAYKSYPNLMPTTFYIYIYIRQKFTSVSFSHVYGHSQSSTMSVVHIWICFGGSVKRAFTEPSATDHTVTLNETLFTEETDMEKLD